METKFKFEKLLFWKKALDLGEVVTCLHKAKRRNYLTEEEFTTNYNESFHLMNRMIAFRNNTK